MKKYWAWKPVDTHLIPAFGVPVSTWFRKFAWLPVWTSDRGWQWMRFVWCRLVQRKDYLCGGPDFWFQYAHYEKTTPANKTRDGE